MLDYSSDSFRFINKADDFHFPLAMGTFQRINFPHLFYTLPPDRWRDPARLVIWDINNFNFVASVFAFSFLRFLFRPFSPHPVWIPAEISHQLEIFIGNMLGYGGDKFFGAGYGKILFVFSMGRLWALKNLRRIIGKIFPWLSPVRALILPWRVAVPHTMREKKWLQE